MTNSTNTTNAYLNSEDINIFPCSKDRSTYNPESRLFYEENISNMIRQVTDTDSYIISGSVDNDGKVTEDLKLSLHGYYVKIRKDTDLLTNLTTGDLDKIFINIFLTKKIISDSNEVIPQELFGQDDDNKKFTAIELSTSAIESTEQEIYSLEILHRDYNGWKLTEDSFSKFNRMSIAELFEIDGIHSI